MYTIPKINSSKDLVNYANTCTDVVNIEIKQDYTCLYLNRDILTINEGIILQVVNVKGVMGKGLAKDIYTKYPLVKSVYTSNKDRLMLGTIMPIPINPNLWIINLICQKDINKSKTKKDMLDYNSLIQCLVQVSNFNNVRFEFNITHNIQFVSYDRKGQFNDSLLHKLADLPIYIPHNMGCGLAEGNWDRVKSILNCTLRFYIECIKPE